MASDEGTNVDSSPLKFGTPEALEEVRNLTDVGDMTRLLHECIAYQRALDLELDTILSHRSDLDKQLSGLQKSAQVLDIVKADADHLFSNISSTSLLADQVSAKVRQLDLGQSRVNDTLLRIDAIVDRSNCLDGVRKALASEDFESAANYVQTFLQLDAKYKDSAASDQRDQLLASKKQLEGIVRRKLAEAVDQRDHSTVLRFIRLYPPLALEEEGLQVYVTYLKKVIAMRSRLEYEQLVEMMSDQQGSSQNQLNFVSCLTNLFKDIVLAIEENDETLRSLCGEDGIVYAICELQEECDSRGSTIIKKYMEYRKLAKVTSEINSYKSDLLSVGIEGPDPRDIEVYLEEILSLTQLGEDYTGYMISKIRGLSSVDPELGPRATKAFRSGNFDLFNRKCLLQDSLASLMNSDPKANAGTIKVITAKLSKSGFPLVVLATRHAYLFDMSLMCWLRVADDCFPASNFSSSWSSGSLHGGELAALQVDVKKFLARRPGWSLIFSLGFYFSGKCTIEKVGSKDPLSLAQAYYIVCM